MEADRSRSRGGREDGGVRHGDGGGGVEVGVGVGVEVGVGVGVGVGVEVGVGTGGRGGETAVFLEGEVPQLPLGLVAASPLGDSLLQGVEFCG